MKKSIVEIGEILSKPVQKQIQGGDGDGGEDPCFSKPVSQCFVVPDGCQVYSCPDGSEYCGPGSFHLSRC
jgi:hypothetical protein